jgi:hypothetical protein
VGEPLELLAEWVDEQPALLNIVVTEVERLYAGRHALNHDCPSLYFTTDDELFPGGQLLTSERFTDDSFWQPVPEHRIAAHYTIKKRHGAVGRNMREEFMQCPPGSAVPQAQRAVAPPGRIPATASGMR